MTISQLIDDLQARQNQVEHLVTATPTGDKRNLLTDANIHLMIAIAALVEVGKKP